MGKRRAVSGTENGQTIADQIEHLIISSLHRAVGPFSHDIVIHSVGHGVANPNVRENSSPSLIGHLLTPQLSAPHHLSF